MPFEVDGFPGAPSTGEELHWDGLAWWTEPKLASATAVTAFLSSLPSAGAAIGDADAMAMRDALPVYDAAREYPEGALAVRGGKVSRKTAYGWREIG